MIITLDVWRTRDDALTAIFKACAASAACRKAHPDVARDAGARSSARSGPDGRDIDIVDPRTGATRARARHVRRGAGRAAAAHVHARKRRRCCRRCCALAARGDLAPLFAANPALAGNFEEQMNAALHFSVTCAEDVPRIRRRRGAAGACRTAHAAARRADHRRVRRLAARHDAGRLRGAGGERQARAAAVRRHGPGHAARRTAPQVAKGFANGRHIVAPGYGHIVSPHACGPRLVAAFVDDGGVAKLPEACVAHFENSVPPLPWPDRLAPRP